MTAFSSWIFWAAYQSIHRINNGTKAKEDVSNNFLSNKRVNRTFNNLHLDDDDIAVSSHNQPQIQKTPTPKVAWDHRAIRDAAPPNKRAVWFYCNYRNTRIPSIRLDDPKQTKFLHSPLCPACLEHLNSSGSFFFSCKIKNSNCTEHEQLCWFRIPHDGLSEKRSSHGLVFTWRWCAGNIRLYRQPKVEET